MSLGIHLGSHHVSTAVVIDGEPRPVKEAHQHRYTSPASVCWDAESGRLLVGEAAEFASRTNPACYANAFKQHLGKSAADTAKSAPHRLGDKTFSTEELVAAVLKQRLADAALLLENNAPTRAVLTVPAHWERYRQDCLRQAARQANLEVHLLTEPIAGALAWEYQGSHKLAEGEPLLVYRLGGSFDVALLTKRNGTFVELVPSQGREDVGGLSFDHAIYQDLVRTCPEPLREQLLRDRSVPAARLRMAIRNECRALKHQLSEAERASIHPPQAPAGWSYTLEATRFEAMIRDGLDATVAECRRMIEEAGLPAGKARVLLTGGSARIPLVARLLEEAFKRPVERLADPELGLCQGAALHAAKVCPSKELDDPELVKVIRAIEKQREEAEKRRFVFLLAGRTGVGKSSTINSLLGKEVAPVGAYEPTTFEVKTYHTQVGKVPFAVVDTPGLCDGLTKAGEELKYLKLMADSAPQIDSLWFVSQLNDTRVRPDEINAIGLITRAFGPDVWKNAVIVFTFGNSIVPRERFGEALRRRGELLRKEIAVHTGGAIADAIPAVAVDNGADTTLDGRKWKGELYINVFNRLSDNSVVTFYLGTAFMLRVKAEEEAKARSEAEAKAREARAHIRARPLPEIEDPTPYPREPRPSQRAPEPTIELSRSSMTQVETRVRDIVTRCADTGASWGRAIAGSSGESIGRSIGTGVGKVLSWLGF